MVSRETRLQLVVGTVATLLLFVAATLLETSGFSTLLGAVVLVYYGLLFGGTHLYLAWRGEGGSVPVDSRWRFLVVLAALLVLGAIGAFGPDGRVAGIRFDAVLAWIGVVILLGYWVLEARDGYLANRPS
mgnify:CR=1 FL=1